MKSKPIIFLWIILLLTTTGAVAQSTQLKKADELFNKFAYAKAIPEYELLVVKGRHVEHAYQRLAECYLLLRDFEKALPYFERFINNAETPSHYYFKYGMALQSVNRDKEAVKWLKRYKRLNKNDKKLRQFLKDGDLASVVFNSRESYEVEPVNFNSEYNDFGAIINNGRVYFSSSRLSEGKEKRYAWDNQPWLDIYYLEEDNPYFDRMSLLRPQKIEGDINSKYHESSLVFSTDYKNDTVIYFTRNNFFENKVRYHEVKHKEEKLVEKTNNLKIYKAEKVDGKWKVVRNMKMNADHYSSGHPTVNENRTKLYFASDRPGGYGGTDIYYCDIHPRGGVGRPVNAGPVVNTAGNEMFPFVNNEGKLFFASDGHMGFGQLDIFATISDPSGEVMDVINLGQPINSDKDDFAFFTNEDGTQGFISSNRKGGKGGDDIYSFNFTPSLYVEGIVYDAVNAKTLDSVTIALTDKNTGNFIKEVTTDKRGYYRMFINRSMEYTLVLNRRTHPEKKVRLSTHNLPQTQKKIEKNVYMEPVMDVKVLADLNKIYFDFDKSNIRPDAARELDKVVQLMLETYPYMTIRLESHTDPVGSHEYNDVLSEKRARSTYQYLISKGVPQERILSYKGFGKRKPVNDCKTKWDCPPEVLELNRRTEFPIENIWEPKGKTEVLAAKSK